MRGLAEQVAADEAADEVVADVAEEGRQEQERREHGDLEDPGAGQRAAGEQQRLAGQERGDDQPGLAEDRREDGRVHPGAPRLDEVREVDVEVQDVPQEWIQGVHGPRPL